MGNRESRQVDRSSIFDSQSSASHTSRHRTQARPRDVRTDGDSQDKTPRALAVLSRHFRKRLVEKRNLALVQGTVQEDFASINAPIGRDPDRRPRWGVMEGGKPAETRFRVLERLGGATFLEL